MRIRTLLLAMVLVTPSISAQQASRGANLGVFTTLQGEWDGEAWMIIGPGPEGRRTLRQQEWVSTGAGGTVIVVKGLGTEKQADGTWVTRHDAFATIYTGRDGKPAMRAFLANGQWMDMDLEVVADGYTWRMVNPQVGLIRYDMRVVDGKWFE